MSLNEESWYGLQMIARSWLDTQQLRIATDSRVLRLLKSGVFGIKVGTEKEDLDEEEKEKELKEVFKDRKALLETVEKTGNKVFAEFIRYGASLKSTEDSFLKTFNELIREEFQDSVFLEWCDAVKGIGPTGILTFVAFINPFYAVTAGKVKAYLGLIPGAQLKAGAKAKWNPMAKGRVWLIVRNIIMARDQYYRQVYDKKRNYYLKECHYEDIIKKPSLCPKFSKCSSRIIQRAARLKRDPKKIPCQGHVTAMSRRFLAGIVVSHAAELLRRSLGLNVDNYHTHRGYIAPKPVDYAEDDKEEKEDGSNPKREGHSTKRRRQP